MDILLYVLSGFSALLGIMNFSNGLNIIGASLIGASISIAILAFVCGKLTEITNLLRNISDNNQGSAIVPRRVTKNVPKSGDVYLDGER